MSKITVGNMINIPEETIIKAAEGDIAAFEEIYRASSAYVYTLAYRVMNNVEDAQEVTQDVFVRIYRSLKRFRFRSQFKTWVYRIAVNTAINLYNKRKKERNKRVYLVDERAIEDIAVQEARTFDDEENEVLVRSMLEELSPQQRACVMLTDIEGYKYEEVSRILNVNIGTVKSRLKRAREKLISRFRKGVEPS